VAPYHDPNDLNRGGPHTPQDSAQDVDGGKMDGFIRRVVAARQRGCQGLNDPSCAAGTQIDVMGWHDAREIPNYWAYAQQFVLQDHMFEPNASWSLPAHLFLVSEWSAFCDVPGDVSTCTDALENPDLPPDFKPGTGHIQPRP